MTASRTGIAQTFKMALPVVMALLCFHLFTEVSAAQPGGVCYRGVNLSGAEYGGAEGIYGTNFIYPSQNTVQYFAGKGMNIIRLPFLWERLQPVRNSGLERNELDRLKNAVELIKSHGMKVILDPHNFGYYRGQRLMTPGLSAPEFANFWVRLSLEFANDESVLFGLMNEPYDIHAKDWLDAANTAIAGIRATGANNMILVPGTHWSGASTWLEDLPNGNNSRVMAGVEDPADNFIYEVHQYLDEDGSGTHETCPNADVALQGLRDVTGWLREQDARGLLGEFGGSKDKACLEGLRAMVQFMEQNPDRWLGWTYWAAGEWWPESEGNNIQPTEKGDRPQLKAIMPGSVTGGQGTCSTLN